ncbi:MAG: DUF1971 domain-containing protein [Aquihabitans sp.]
MDHGQMPEGLTHARTTNEFDATTVPAGLLRAHTVAANVWGRVQVRAGSLRFVWEGGQDEGSAVDMAAGDSLVIPPLTHHRVEPGEDARFVVEFYR